MSNSEEGPSYGYTKLRFEFYKSPVCLVYHFWVVMPTVSVRKVAVEIFTCNFGVGRA